MTGEPVVTVVGNLTKDVELRFTNSGIPVANFTVASTPRTFDKQTGQWQDGEALFMRCNVWRDYAENVAESLFKGTNVIVQGHLKQRSYQDKEGNNRTSIEMDVLEVGPALRYGKATFTKVNRNAGNGGFSGPQQGYNQGAPQGGYNNQQGGYNQQQTQQQPPANDPWGSSAAPF